MKTEKSPRLLAITRLLPGKRRWIVVFFLLVVVEIILFFLGPQYYGMVAIPFFFLVILTHPRNFALVAATVLVIILLNTPTLDSWKKFNGITSSVYHRFPLKLVEIFTPGSGEDVLPEKVRTILSLTRKHPLANYRLEKSFEKDGDLTQRIVEAVWPLKMEKTSPYLFGLTTEIKNDPNCEIVDQKEDVALAYCH
jgi:hypothetical protein